MTTLRQSTSVVNTNVDSDATSAIPVSATPSDTADKTIDKHNAVVADIVDAVCSGYESEGTRNLKIGKRIYNHARWQLGNFPGYEPQDFDRLLTRIADDVRVRVQISSKSIKLGEWVRCYVLKTLVSESAGPDVANAVSFFEYRTIYGKALSFSKKDVEGSLVEGWLDFVKDIAAIRSTGTAVSSDAFMAKFNSHAKVLADSKSAALDPATAAAKAALQAERDRKRAVDKSNEDITSSISDALAAKHLDGPAVMSIVEAVAKAHAIPLPSAFGFDPASCDVESCELLADVMFKSGKFAEMVALRDRLDKMIAKVERAREAARFNQDVATSKVEPVAA